MTLQQELIDILKQDYLREEAAKKITALFENQPCENCKKIKAALDETIEMLERHNAAIEQLEKLI